MSTQNQEGEKVRVTDENFNELDYLASNPDIARSVREGVIFSGWSHFKKHGQKEGRMMRVTSSAGPQKPYSLLTGAKKAIFRWLYRIRYPQSYDFGLYPLRTSENAGTSGALESLESLQNQLSDIQILLKQITSILRWEMNLPPPPPKHLQTRVVGKYDEHFVNDGMSFVPVLNRLLRPVGKELKDFQSILDYGCGCGRAIRGLATLLPNSKIYGTDIDPEAIAWLKNNYSKFAEFSVAPHTPPTVYNDQTFDFIFGVSVMTHLPEDMQFQWLEELNRITKPGGYVMLSVHGEKIYRPFGKEVNDIMDKKGFLYYLRGGFNYGKSISLPDFYQTTFHSHAYIQQEWKKYFDIIDIQAAGRDQGLDERQDSVLLQKRM